MNGTDHHLPQPGLGPGRCRGKRRPKMDYHFEITSLAEYLEVQPITGLPDWWGELRSGARANVLMGVASNRVDVHQACARAERSLERRAEPLSALFLPAEQYPQRLIDEAWHLLVLNSAHDSSCACSNDEVVAAVLSRYHEARQLADALADDAVEQLSAKIDAEAGAIVVVNPAAASRAGSRGGQRARRRPDPFRLRRRRSLSRAGDRHRRRGRHLDRRRGSEDSLGARSHAWTRVRRAAGHTRHTHRRARRQRRRRHRRGKSRRRVARSRRAARRSCSRTVQRAARSACVKSCPPVA